MMFDKDERVRVAKNLTFFCPVSLANINQCLAESSLEPSLVKITKSRKGLPIFKLGDQLRHSQYDPLKEGLRKWQNRNYQDQKFIFNLNNDFLYEMEAGLHDFKKNGSNHSELFLVYSKPEIFMEMLRVRDLSFLTVFKKVRVYFPENLAAFKLAMSEINEEIFISHDPHSPLPDNFTEQVLRCLEEHRKKIISAKITQLNFEIRWLKNFIKNIYHLDNAFPLANLVNVFKGQKAMVVGAGISIYHRFAEISERKKNGEVLFLVDTCLPAFLKRGIIPDFVVALDGGYYNSLDFKDLLTFAKAIERNETKLLTSLIFYPPVLNYFTGKKYFFYFKNNNSIIENLGYDVFQSSKRMSFLDKKQSLVQVGSSVASVMLSVVAKLGFKRADLWGFDFKGFFFQNHLCESIHWEHYYSRATRLEPTTHYEFKEVFYSLDEEERIKIKSQKNYFATAGVNLRKYGDEFAGSLRLYPEIHWKKINFAQEISLFPENGEKPSGGLKRFLGLKKIFYKREKINFVSNLKKSLQVFKGLIVAFLREHHQENLAKINDFLATEPLLKKIFSSEFSMEEVSSMTKQKSYFVLKKISIMENNLISVEKRSTG